MKLKEIISGVGFLALIVLTKPERTIDISTNSHTNGHNELVGEDITRNYKDLWDKTELCINNLKREYDLSKNPMTSEPINPIPFDSIDFVVSEDKVKKYCSGNQGCFRRATKTIYHLEDTPYYILTHEILHAQGYSPEYLPNKICEYTPSCKK